jgi:hypothetical protein
MKTSEQTYRIAFAVAIVAATVSTGVHAEYRCATPERLTNEETRACELARQDSPDALIHFVNRTKAIYNLYANDYVSQADVERWELAKRKEAPDAPAIAKMKADAKGTSKAD